MCRNNCNIVEAENKEKRERNSRLSYEERVEIESMLRRRKKRTKVYYTDSYSSWQKGMNENCNGILRRFIPKGTDLETISEYKLEIILEKINGKPRKILNFTSAEELFNIEINKIKGVA